MPVIDPERKPAKKVVFATRLDPRVVEKLRTYCEFLDCSSQHHVVEQLLEFAFRSDADFQAWLERHGTTRKRDLATAKPASREESS